MSEWLKSCAGLRGGLPPEVLVLPSHGLPFIGADRRLSRLIQLHEDALDRVRVACEQPKTAVDILSVLFTRKLEGEHLYMATGEALAHLHYLEKRAELHAELKRGRRYFSRI